MAILAIFPPPPEGRLGSSEFCESPSLEIHDSLPYCGLAFLTQSLATDIVRSLTSDFHESRQESIMEQTNLFHGEHIPPRIRYRTLFGYLPRIPSPQGAGRPAVDPNAILRALIYRNLRKLTTLSDLVHALSENPSLVEAIDLDPFAPVPSIERFSAWLRSTPNECLQEVRVNLVEQLVQKDIIQGKVISLDSSPVPSPVRENNLKTSVADRFNKNRYPRADPEARLGVYRIYAGSGSQKIRYFWGYRNHVAVDFDTELPLWEITRPANIHESRVAVSMLEACAPLLKSPIEIVCGDSAYDFEKFLTYVIEQLHARPIIARNKRSQAQPNFRIEGKDVFCPADLPMVYKGRMTPKRTGITYKQYCCPLHYNKAIRQRFLLCPADHPKFIIQKGCNYLVRVTPSYRTQIDYGSAEFKEIYMKRTSVERVFSRLLSMAMQTPSVHGLLSTSNQCTIAHITALLVAVAAHEQGHTDKLAFVRSFVPNFMT
jgi:hypothetical protein